MPPTTIAYMIRSVFFDTGAFIALANKHDQYHVAATEKLNRLLKSPARFYTTTFVFSKTVTRIGRSVSSEHAIRIGTGIRNEERLTIINPGQDCVDDAWDICTKYKDQGFSFVDCLSFAVMYRMDIKNAFAFDEHFRIMKFLLV